VRQSGDERDAPMAEADQVLDRLAGCAHVVNDDGVHRHAGDLSVEQDRRCTLTCAKVLIARDVSRRRPDQSVDAAAPHELQVDAFLLDVLVGIAQDDGVPREMGRVLHAARHRREERVGDVRHDQPQRLGCSVLQAASNAMRLIARRVDGVPDPSRKRLADVLRPVGNSRNGCH